MPRKSAQPQVDEDKVYVAFESAATMVGPHEVVILKGDRRRGDDPVVQATSWLWVSDGSLFDEIAAARRAAFPDIELGAHR